MRAGLLLIVLVMATVATTTRPRNFSQLTKLRGGRPREIRGFKPEYISTAIGFGKREEPLEYQPGLSGKDRILYTLLRKFPRGVPLDFLLREMKSSPAFAGKLTQLLLQDTDQDVDQEVEERGIPEDRTVFLF